MPLGPLSPCAESPGRALGTLEINAAALTGGAMRGAIAWAFDATDIPTNHECSVYAMPDFGISSDLPECVFKLGSAKS